MNTFVTVSPRDSYETREEKYVIIKRRAEKALRRARLQRRRHDVS